MARVVLVFSDERGFLAPGVSHDEQLETIRSLAAGGIYHNPPFTQLIHAEIEGTVISERMLRDLHAALDAGSSILAKTILNDATAAQVL